MVKRSRLYKSIIVFGSAISVAVPVAVVTACVLAGCDDGFPASGIADAGGNQFHDQFVPDSGIADAGSLPDRFVPDAIGIADAPGDR